MGICDMKKSEIKSKELKRLIYWPLAVLPVVLVLTGICLLAENAATESVMIFFLIWIVFSIWWFFFWRKRLVSALIEFAENFDGVRKAQMRDLPIPFALFRPDGTFLWANRFFREMHQGRYGKLQNLSNLSVQLAAHLPEKDEVLKARITIDDRIYDTEMTLLGERETFISLCMQDVTRHIEAMDTIEAMKPVVGQIFIDNYDELMSSTDPLRQSFLAALTERKIGTYFAKYDGIVKKLDSDKFSLTMSKGQLERIRQDRFSLLDDIRNVTKGNAVLGGGVQPTISIGIGVDGESITANDRFARNAIDLCLGRGGDQAIIRTPSGPEYFGGKTQQQEKGTRVKARVKAQALRELLETKDKILIMGHQNSDIDSLGSAIGIARIAKILKKEAYLVLENPNSSLHLILEAIGSEKSDTANLIIDSEKAKTLLDKETVLVVVDVNRPSYTECPALIDKAENIVVLDHHRQAGEAIPNAILSYIEPFASSASEMVAEILQYIGDDVKMPAIEADAMYAGIVIDTNNFLTKTGVRTFEAAAYLRRQGADVVRVRKYFRDNMEDFRAKAEAVRNAEIFEEAFALSICPGEGLESPMIVGAQAANDLLDIVGIKASFVFTKCGDKVYISARSIDEVNVQLIMERLGGGGHMSVAGAQLSGCTAEDAMALAKATIGQMLEEGAI